MQLIVAEGPYGGLPLLVILFLVLHALENRLISLDSGLESLVVANLCRKEFRVEEGYG